MAVETASLTTFLRTGALGPITTESTAADVGRLLGAPKSFVVNDGELFPAYWSYDHLEISFAAQANDKPPYGMHFFQLEYAYRFKGKYAWAAEGRLRIGLDGLSARSRLSAYALAIADLPDAMVTARRFDGSTDWEVYLSTPRINAVFATDIKGKSAAPEHLSQLDDGETARRIERHARIDSIYAYPPKTTFGPQGTTRRTGRDDWREWRIADYLAAVGVTA